MRHSQRDWGGVDNFQSQINDYGATIKRGIVKSEYQLDNYLRIYILTDYEHQWTNRDVSTVIITPYEYQYYLDKINN